MTSTVQTAVNKTSLINFINNSTISNRIDLDISKATKLRIVFSNVFVEAYVGRLAYVGIHTIEDLAGLLGKKKLLVTKFVQAWFWSPAGNHSSLIPAGIGISFLCWTMALEKGGVKALTEFLTRHAFNSNRAPDKLARDLENAYEKTLP